MLKKIKNLREQNCEGEANNKQYWIVRILKEATLVIKYLVSLTLV